MSLPTNRQINDVVDPADINAIAAAVNAGEALADNSVIPLILPGKYLANLGLQTTGTITPTLDRLTVTPIWFDAGTYDRIGVLVRTAGSAGQFWDMAIYDRTGALVLNAASLDVSTVGYKEAVMSLSIATRGVYYIAGRVSGDTTTIAVLNRADPHVWMVPTSTDIQYSPHGGMIVTHLRTNPFPASGLFSLTTNPQNYSYAVRVRRAP